MLIEGDFPGPEILLLVQVIAAPLIVSVMVFGTERTVLFFERLFRRDAE